MSAEILAKLRNELGAIVILLVAIVIVLWRLPKVEIEHSAEFKRRRFMNWFPLGITYALLYFGRYDRIGAIIGGIIGAWPMIARNAHAPERGGG